MGVACPAICLLPPSFQTGDLANADATEEEKMMAMMSQSGEGFEPSQYVLVEARLCTNTSTPPPLLFDTQVCKVFPSWIHRRGRRRRGRGWGYSPAWTHEATSPKLHLLSVWPEGSLDQAVSDQWGEPNFLFSFFLTTWS